MKVFAVLIILTCCASVCFACSKKCKGNSVDVNGASQKCCGGTTKIKLEIDIKGGCKCKKHKKRQSESSSMENPVLHNSSPEPQESDGPVQMI